MQSQNKPAFLFGQVYSFDEKLPLDYVHIVNKKTLDIAVSDPKGFFRISVHKNDILIITSVGYKKKEILVQDSLLSGKVHFFYLKPQRYLLENVSVGQYKLSGYTDIDVQLIPDKKFIPDINLGIPKKEDVERKPIHKPGIMNPVDLLYDIFGDTPKQMRMIEKIRLKRRKEKEKKLLLDQKDTLQSEK